MTKAELKDLGYIIWKLLKEEQREEYYYDTGILGFIETMCDLAKFNIDEFTCEELDEFMNNLC